MTKYDQHTWAFMNQFADEMEAIAKTAEEKKDEQPKPEDEHLTLKPIRTAKQIFKGVEDPRKALGKIIIRTALSGMMDKQGSIKLLTLYKFMNEHYKQEWWDWEPETIWDTLEQDHLDATPEEIKAAVMALQVTLNTFAPFEQWNIFEKVGHAFNMNPVDFSIIQPLEPDEIALTIHVLSKIRPNTEYDLEILQYISACAKNAGMVYLPEDMFPGAQKCLDEITFEHDLRDATKTLWENPKADISRDQKKVGISRDQLEIQIYKLLDVKKYLVKEVGIA